MTGIFFLKKEGHFSRTATSEEVSPMFPTFDTCKLGRLFGHKACLASPNTSFVFLLLVFFFSTVAVQARLSTRARLASWFETSSHARYYPEASSSDERGYAVAV